MVARVQLALTAGDQHECVRSGGQESHMIVRAAEANALVFVHTGQDELPVGSVVRYLPL